MGSTVTDGGYTYTTKSTNIITNGSFESGFMGWTIASDFTTEISSSSNFELRTDSPKDGSNYLVGTSTSQSSGTAGGNGTSSLGTAWSIETGKTYYFCYWIKNLDGTTETTYLKTSLTNTKGDENNGKALGYPASVSSDWQRVDTVFTNDSYAYLQVKFRWLASHWGFDDFQLYEVEKEGSLIDDDEYHKDDTYSDGAFKVLSDNLFVNGGFNDGVEGWTAGGYETAAAEENFTIHTGGGYNGGAYLTSNQSAGAASEYTISQAIAVEKDAYYLFIGYTNGDTPQARYSALFEMNDEGTAELDHEEDDGHTYSNEIVRLTWGDGTEWTKTESVFLATTSYVGMRMGWTTSSYDGFQLYKLEVVVPEDASPDNPVDLTSLITNPNAYDYSYNGWTCSNNVNGMTRKNGEHWDGTDASYFEPDDWSYTLWEEDMYQTITLPYDGVYKLTAAGRSSDEARTTLFAGDVEHVFPALGATGGTIATDGTTCKVGTEGYTFANDGAGYGWTWGSVEVDGTSGSALTIGAKFQSFTADTHQWASIVNFKLEYLGSADDTKIDAAKEDLSEYIDYAETIDTETNVGSGAFQRPQTVVDALTSAITAAKSALEASNATEENLLAALSALEKAVDDFENATLNTPATGQTFAIVMKEEFEKDNVQYYDKAVVFNFTNESSGCCFFDEGWNRNYAPENFTFTPDNSKTNGYIISTVTENGTTYYLKLNTDNLGIRATTSKEDAFVFQMVATETEGIWHIYNSAAHMNVGSNGDRGFYTDNAHTNLYLASNAIPVNITAAGWTTLVLPYDAELPSSDLKAYTITGYSDSDEEVTLTKVEGTLAANTPYLINGSDIAEYAINGTSTVFDLENTPSDSYLVGTWTDISSVPTGNYLLQYQPDARSTAFYIVEDSDLTLAANRCYLNGSSVSTANAPYFSLSMGDDVATAIESALEAAQSEGNEAIYDLSGRKVSKAQKGIYIKGGKKVIIK